MARNLLFSEGEFYHIYNRGNDKRIVFLNEADYQRFQALLYLANSKTPVHISNHQGSTLMELLSIERGDPIVDIGAYCLMQNHFHILVRERMENGISMFMQKLSTGYTMYFNRRRDRTGALFEGRFRATHVDGDEYLKYLFAYIHLNPVKIIDPLWKENGIEKIKEARRFLDTYKYSSYIDYGASKRKESVIISRGAFPDYFHEQNSFQDFVLWWLDFKNKLE